MPAEIPYTYRTNRRGGRVDVFVRAKRHGRTKHAPFSNDWLRDRGERAVSDPVRRAAAIHRLLVADLDAEREDAAHGAQQGTLSVSEAAQAFIDAQESLAAVRRPSDGLRKRRRSVLLQGTPRRPSLVEFLGDPMVRSVRPDELRAFERQLEDAGYAAESLRSLMADVVRLFHWASERRLIESCPAGRGGYTLPAGGELDRERGAYTPQEMAELRDALRAGWPHLYRAFVIVSQTGVRRSEYLRLTREMVGRDSIQVPGARKNRERRIRHRLVPVSRDLAPFLRSMCLPRGAFLASGKPEPLTASCLQSSSRRFSAKTELEISLQRLRRTYGQRLLDAGATLPDLVEWMGSTAKTLKRWYVFPSARHLSGAGHKALSLDLRHRSPDQRGDAADSLLGLP